MADTPDFGSVRVEFEDGSTSMPPPIGPGRGGVSRTTIGLVIGAALVVAVILFAVRPAESPAPIAGSSSTTSTSTPTTTTSSQEFDADQQGPFVQTTEAQPFQSIIRAPVGFLGLSWDVGRDGMPVLKRSVDGISWTPYQVNIPDDGVDLDPNRGPFRAFESLIRVQDGYAMVMSTVTTPENGSVLADPEFRLRRLISRDGATWDFDPAFDEIVVNRSYARVDSHTEDLFLTQEFSNSNDNDELAALFVEHAVDGSDYSDGGQHEGVCWISDMDEVRLVLNFCNSAGEITLGPEDFVDPDEFERLGRCAVYVAQTQSNSTTVTVNDREKGQSRLGGPRSGGRTSVVLDSGAIVSVDFGPAPWSDRGSCDAFMELDELPPPAVVIWEPEDRSTPVRVNLAGDVDLTTLLGARTRPAVLGREILFVGESSVQTINIDSGVQASMLLFPSPVSAVSSARVSPDVSQVLLANQDGLTVLDLLSGEARSIINTGPRSILEIVYADNEVAFVTDGAVMYKVELQLPAN